MNPHNNYLFYVSRTVRIGVAPFFHLSRVTELIKALQITQEKFIFYPNDTESNIYRCNDIPISLSNLITLSILLID